ncbi:metal ABC transporter ATP-binding protein [Vibrio sp. ABG19]|uniref:metal ABC transporter ATP-binding protein n=1 Tax=Vibrio sp. ABG19 TaxID=2817385 RepID=UPI00249E56CC|nr:metal ABC transporter ATP-binding protein [Vibrio sp. ABG19]WGY45182.1 metal ABC transporter ATP-binding protein [Vibrio sp. ABG19]
MMTLDQLVVGYRGQAVTLPVSGRFKPGSLTAIMGPNGAGKSTLVKTLCGLQSPVSGRLDAAACMSHIAWLPQRAEMDNDFPISVYEVVAMGCWPKQGISKALGQDNHIRIERALTDVGIGDLAARTIGELSGGQFQRMLFARMLVQDADVMMMDEPFAGIDQATQQILLQLMLTLNQQGKTVIAVLHDVTLVRRYFPQLLLIMPDQVRWGATDELLTEQRYGSDGVVIPLFHQESLYEHTHH